MSSPEDGRPVEYAAKNPNFFNWAVADFAELLFDVRSHGGFSERENAQVVSWTAEQSPTRYVLIREDYYTKINRGPQRFYELYIQPNFAREDYYLYTFKRNESPSKSGDKQLFLEGDSWSIDSYRQEVINHLKTGIPPGARPANTTMEFDKITAHSLTRGDRVRLALQTTQLLRWAVPEFVVPEGPAADGPPVDVSEITK